MESGSPPRGRDVSPLTTDGKAALLMAVVAALITVSCSCPVAALTTPAATATSTPTKTPRPSSSPIPTQTSMPPVTPTSTVTNTPTQAPTAIRTEVPTRTPLLPTATARPPTATATPERPNPTPTPGWQYRYLEGSMQTHSNCGSVYLEGEIRNSAGAPLDGVTVRLRWWDNVEYELSGLAGGHSPGKWGFSPLSPDQNRAYQPFILDVVESRYNPVPLSEELHVEMVDCSQAGQFTEITFVSAQ